MAIEAGGTHPYVEESTVSLVRIEEKGRSACFRNPERGIIRRIRVDGGLITEGMRADFVVSKPEMVDVIAELKGSDTARAIKQIQATFPIWIRHALCGRRWGALIVTAQGIHPKHQANVQRWKTQFEIRYGVILRIETRNREYDFDEFVPRDQDA
ncbi:hypothetical protein DYQ86_13935 [Acidobacteria bacterium AB60]|nr:hypothetical protein DYQ86_13935 [Acidobacteria bacterium AB60]